MHKMHGKVVFVSSYMDLQTVRRITWNSLVTALHGRFYILVLKNVIAFITTSVVLNKKIYSQVYVM